MFSIKQKLYAFLFSISVIALMVIGGQDVQLRAAYPYDNLDELLFISQVEVPAANQGNFYTAIADMVTMRNSISDIYARGVFIEKTLQQIQKKKEYGFATTEFIRIQLQNAKDKDIEAWQARYDAALAEYGDLEALEQEVVEKYNAVLSDLGITETVAANAEADFSEGNYEAIEGYAETIDSVKTNVKTVYDSTLVDNSNMTVELKQVVTEDNVGDKHIAEGLVATVDNIDAAFNEIRVGYESQQLMKGEVVAAVAGENRALAEQSESSEMAFAEEDQALVEGMEPEVENIKTQKEKVQDNLAETETDTVEGEDILDIMMGEADAVAAALLSGDDKVAKKLAKEAEKNTSNELVIVQNIGQGIVNKKVETGLAMASLHASVNSVVSDAKEVKESHNRNIKSSKSGKVAVKQILKQKFYDDAQVLKNLLESANADKPKNQKLDVNDIPATSTVGAVSSAWVPAASSMPYLNIVLDRDGDNGRWGLTTYLSSFMWPWYEVYFIPDESIINLYELEYNDVAQNGPFAGISVGNDRFLVFHLDEQELPVDPSRYEIETELDMTTFQTVPLKDENGNFVLGDLITDSYYNPYAFGFSGEKTAAENLPTKSDTLFYTSDIERVLESKGLSVGGELSESIGGAMLMPGAGIQFYGNNFTAITFQENAINGDFDNYKVLGFNQDGFIDNPVAEEAESFFSIGDELGLNVHWINNVFYGSGVIDAEPAVGSVDDAMLVYKNLGYMPVEYSGTTAATEDSDFLQTFIAPVLLGTGNATMSGPVLNVYGENLEGFGLVSSINVGGLGYLLDAGYRFDPGFESSYDSAEGITYKGYARGFRIDQDAEGNNYSNIDFAIASLGYGEYSALTSELGEGLTMWYDGDGETVSGSLTLFHSVDTNDISNLKAGVYTIDDEDYGVGIALNPEMFLAGLSNNLADITYTAPWVDKKLSLSISEYHTASSFIASMELPKFIDPLFLVERVPQHVVWGSWGVRTIDSEGNPILYPGLNNFFVAGEEYTGVFPAAYENLSVAFRGGILRTLWDIGDDNNEDLPPLISEKGTLALGFENGILSGLALMPNGHLIVMSGEQDGIDFTIDTIEEYALFDYQGLDAAPPFQKTAVSYDSIGEGKFAGDPDIFVPSELFFEMSAQSGEGDYAMEGVGLGAYIVDYHALESSAQFNPRGTAQGVEFPGDGTFAIRDFVDPETAIRDKALGIELADNLVFIQKEAYYVEQAQDLPGIVGLPSLGQTWILALPGTETLQHVSWGIWGNVQGESASLGYFAGAPAFRIAEGGGVEDNTLWLFIEYLDEQIPDTNTGVKVQTYYGPAIGSVFSGNNPQFEVLHGNAEVTVDYRTTAHSVNGEVNLGTQYKILLENGALFEQQVNNGSSIAGFKGDTRLEVNAVDVTVPDINNKFAGNLHGATVEEVSGTYGVQGEVEATPTTVIGAFGGKR